MLSRFCIAVLCLMSLEAVAGDLTSEAIIKQVEYLQKKHEVLASNVANVSTPKYIAQDIDKPDLVKHKNHKVTAPKIRLITTNERHLQSHKSKAGGKYQMTKDMSGAMKPNKNNVALSNQIEKMAVNSDETALALKNYRSSMDLIAAGAESAGGGR